MNIHTVSVYFRKDGKIKRCLATYDNDMSFFENSAYLTQYESIEALQNADPDLYGVIKENYAEVEDNLDHAKEVWLESKGYKDESELILPENAKDLTEMQAYLKEEELDNAHFWFVNVVKYCKENDKVGVIQRKMTKDQALNRAQSKLFDGVNASMFFMNEVDLSEELSEADYRDIMNRIKKVCDFIYEEFDGDCVLE